MYGARSRPLSLSPAFAFARSSPILLLLVLLLVLLLHSRVLYCTVLHCTVRTRRAARERERVRFYSTLQLQLCGIWGHCLGANTARRTGRTDGTRRPWPGRARMAWRRRSSSLTNERASERTNERTNGDFCNWAGPDCCTAAVAVCRRCRWSYIIAREPAAIASGSRPVVVVVAEYCPHRSSSSSPVSTRLDSRRVSSRSPRRKRHSAHVLQPRRRAINPFPSSSAFTSSNAQSVVPLHPYGAYNDSPLPQPGSRRRRRSRTRNVAVLSVHRCRHRARYR